MTINHRQRNIEIDYDLFSGTDVGLGRRSGSRPLAFRGARADSYAPFVGSRNRVQDSGLWDIRVDPLATIEEPIPLIGNKSVPWARIALSSNDRPRQVIYRTSFGHDSGSLCLCCCATAIRRKESNTKIEGVTPRW